MNDDALPRKRTKGEQRAGCSEKGSDYSSDDRTARKRQRVGSIDDYESPNALDEDEELDEHLDDDSATSGEPIEQEPQTRKRTGKTNSGFDLGFHSSSHKQGSDEQSSSHMQRKSRQARR